MRLRTFFANLLANVPLLQCLTEPAAKEPRDQQRRDRRVCRAKRDVLKDVEGLYEIPILFPEMEVKEFVKEVIDHYPWSSPANGNRSRNAFTTLSVATPREPFTKIKSPSLT